MTLEAHSDRMALVIADAKADALALDSTPFTPRGMGEALGQILAQVAAIADTLAYVLTRLGEESESA